MVEGDENTGTLQFKISGRELKDLDFFSKSDPICVVETLRQDMWVTLNQTERIMNNLNPDFKKPIEIQYESKEQMLKFTFWDHDGGQDFELIGHADVTVEELCTNAEIGTDWEAPLIHPDKPNSKRGQVRVQVNKL